MNGILPVSRTEDEEVLMLVHEWDTLKKDA
jgi:hypothetical protein